jgi:DNA replication initiation complex subunit (GINS family)
MITFNDIYEFSRKERNSEKLQKLPGNFIEEISEYFEEKKGISLKNGDSFSDVVVKTKKQLESAITFFRELMNRRRKKIFDLILISAETGSSKKDLDNMLDFEKKLFEELIVCVKSSDEKLNETLEKKRDIKKSEQKIIFKENVEEFVGLDGEKMGPFEKGQIANISKEIAKILIEDSKVDVFTKT